MKRSKTIMPRKAKHREPFAHRLIQIRKARNISQYELARLAGISHRLVAHYETVVRNPASGTVIHLAKALKVSVDELMGFKKLKEITGEVLSRKSFRKAKLLDRLPEKDKKTVYRMIDALSTKGNHNKKD
jgi:transcriptional regulator with XRE-family HTH domain